MNKEEFIKEIKTLGLDITDEILSKLDIYADFLLEYNKRTNLTAIKTKEDIYLKHFYDSLTLVKVIDLKKQDTLLDIGSGAGFPGMVLKIFFSNLKVFLVDSNNKKTKFLETLKEKLNVSNLEIINKRIEDITPKYLNYFDVVTARAVINMPVLTEISMPLVKVNKYFIAMKGSNAEEIESGKYAIDVMDGKIENIMTFNLLEAGGRTIVKVRKLKESNQKNLRRYEKIVKNPLKK